MTAHIFTANRLLDGAVVFLDENGTWNERMDLAGVLTDEAALKAAEAAGQRDEAARLIVGAYAVEIDPQARPAQPLRLRERIRGAGPTIAYGDAAPGKGAEIAA